MVVRPLFALFVALASAAWAWGADAPTAEARPADVPPAADANAATGDAAAASPEEIAELVRQLDANRFSQRQAASIQLATLGKAAVPALVEAALQGNREVTTRAVDILKQHHLNGEGDLRQAAKEALEKLAASNVPAAASRASEALKPKENQIAPFGPAGVVPGNIQVLPAQIQLQIQVQAIGGPGRRVTVKNVNGVKDIEVEEGDRKVKIHEAPGEGIKLEVTTKKDGKESTEKFEAKDADELKKNHPEAHKIYEQYNQQGAGGLRIQGIQAIPGLPQAIPLPAQRIAPAPEQMQALRDAQQRLREAAERLRAAAPQGPDSDEFRKAQQELEEVQKELRGALEGLRPQAVPLPAPAPAEEAQPIEDAAR